VFEFLSDPGTWVVALVTLTVLEIVLGIDNIVFISILVGKLPKEDQDWPWSCASRSCSRSRGSSG
jgi:predicted tellurium resistance membrane protein TerC